jgi:periplasmic protein CpxP/Spy
MTTSTHPTPAMPARAWRMMALGLLIAAASLASQLAMAMPMGERGAPGRHAMPMGGGFGHGMSERMLDSVNATPEQRSRIRDIMKAAHDDMARQREAGQALRDQAMGVFTQPTIDARAAETLRQQMLAHHDQASKRTMQAMLDAAAVLTPEQRKQLAERMAQRRTLMQRHRAERDALERPSR